MLDELRVVQMAAERIGGETPVSLDEVLGEDSLALVYDAVVDFCLDLHPWDFTRELRQLSRLADITSPVLGYPFAYALPADAVGDPLRVVADLTFPDAPFHAWTRHGAMVLAAIEPLYAVIATRPVPARWTGSFREAVVLALSGEFALSMASNEGLRDTLRRDAYGTPSEAFRGGAIGVAIRSQAHRSPAKRLPTGHNPFSEAWRG